MKVSIITINYNNAKGLKKTLDSIVSQNQADFEYIVIDGDSTDGSQNIIEEYSKQISYWISEPDSGIYNAMNKGIRQATGEYVLFINSGDVIRTETNLSSIISQITGEDIIFFDLEVCDISNNRYVKIYPDSLDFKYFAEDSLPHMASFIKKDLLAKYGYYSEKIKISSDWAFFMDAVCLLNCTYKHIHEYFSTFYLDGLSSDERNRQILTGERNNHISSSYRLYNSLYEEWMEKKQELYKLKTSTSVRYLKKIGLLKWLKL